MSGHAACAGALARAGRGCGLGPCWDQHFGAKLLGSNVKGRCCLLRNVCLLSVEWISCFVVSFLQVLQCNICADQVFNGCGVLGVSSFVQRVGCALCQIIRIQKHTYTMRVGTLHESLHDELVVNRRKLIDVDSTQLVVESLCYNGGLICVEGHCVGHEIVISSFTI